MKPLWIVGAAIGALIAATGVADAQHRGGYGGYHGHDFHGRDFHSFGPHEIGIWRGGFWHHGYYGGVFGWYWVVDGYYYPYAAPIYPYPEVVATVAYPAPASAPPPPQAPVQVWYACDNPHGFYPYVQSCPGGWREVPASPPPSPGAAMPPPPGGAAH